ncbi:MAG: TlpA family protein disulfide reductase [Planctomycetes bacterium]|nr:TlpA family protein disulfide reductase [Planctomycetota bacterium]
MRTLALLAVLAAGDEKYYLGKELIDLNDVVAMGGRTYIRARRLEGDLKIVWRFATGGKTVGVMRDGVGGRALKIGPGEEALVHSRDLFLSLDAIRDVLNARVVRETGKVVIDPRAKAGADLEPRRSALGPGDRMVDFAFPPLQGADPVQLSKHRGKRVLLVIWASWDASRGGLAEWQKIQAAHRNDDLAVVACAVGAEGVERGRACVPGNVVYATARDPHWRLVSAFGLRTFPQWVLVDEVGFVRATSDMENPSPPGPEFEEAFAKLKGDEGSKLRAWIPDEAWKARDLEKDLAKKESAALRLALSRTLFRDDPNRAAAEARKALAADPESWEAAIHVAAALWQGGKNEEGVAALKEYLGRKDIHTLVRRQKWAVEFPEKVYADVLDAEWLREQEEKERRGE